MSKVKVSVIIVKVILVSSKVMDKMAAIMLESTGWFDGLVYYGWGK